MKDVLVIGGGGYIGSHMVVALNRAGYKPVVLDNFSSGHRDAVRNAEIIEGDLGDSALLNNLFSKRKFEGILHFASSILVGESVADPAKYYDNNVARTISLINAVKENKAGPFIFSSTAAVFGNPEYTPIDEAHSKSPINPYGQTKLMVEKILEDYGRAYGFAYGVLRYFNAAGSDTEAEIGERHDPETHLIPLVLQAASGRRKSITIFGQDYDTPDGTCIRDYIHVKDLADAHIKLLQLLYKEGGQHSFNLGTGHGFSVREVIDKSKAITGIDFKVEVAERRAGDPSVLVADGRNAKQHLNWQPQFSDIDTIIKDAWVWEKNFS